MTEGSVYGMRVPNASRLRTMEKVSRKGETGVIIYEGEAADLFCSHPIEGPYSLLKRIQGECKTKSPGDIIFDPSNACKYDPRGIISEGNVLVIREAACPGVFHGQPAWLGYSRLWGRRTTEWAVPYYFCKEE